MRFNEVPKFRQGAFRVNPLWINEKFTAVEALR
jgi:hypothetical protein